MNNKVIYADLIRVAATFTAINLHAAGPILYDAKGMYNASWWIANISDSASRWCVPAFIMISGMFLLNPDKTEPISTFLKRRFTKVLIPLVVWGILYSLWTVRYDILYGNVSNVPVYTLFKNFIQGKAYFHLWFLYMISGLYLITPLIKIFIKNAKSKDFIYYFILWIIVNAVFGLIKKFFNLSIGIMVEPLTGFLGYYVLGYYLSRTDINKKHRNIIYFLGVLGLVVTVWGTYILTIRNNNKLDEYFYIYLNLTVIAMSSAVFLAIKHLVQNLSLIRKPSFIRILSVLSSASFGIYLLHPVVLEMLLQREIVFMFNPLVRIIMTDMIAVAVCFPIIWFIQKIPVIKYIAP